MVMAVGAVLDTCCGSTRSMRGDAGATTYENVVPSLC